MLFAHILTIESYVTVLVLDPTQKAAHINRYWGEELLHEALQNTKSMVSFPPLFAGLFDTIFKYKEHHLEMYRDSTNRTLMSADLQTASTGNHKLDVLLDELFDGEEEETVQHAPSALSHTSSMFILDSVDPSKPWLCDFYTYLNSKDHLGEMTIVQWWGINLPRYPVWALLACNFLSIMASLVSSERAFSSAGITISKRRNRLKANVVETLQCLKCMLKRGLLFCEDPSIMTEVDKNLDKHEKGDGDLGYSWDTLVEDDKCMDSEDGDVFVQMLDTL